MSRAAYTKMWAMTSQYNARRNFGWAQVMSRSSVWVVPLGMFWTWMLFPQFNDKWQKVFSLGMMHYDGPTWRCF